jgi:hypothetical protein
MIVAELWNRFFLKVFRSTGAVVSAVSAAVVGFAAYAPSSGTTTLESGAIASSAFVQQQQQPAWLQALQSLVLTAIRRGTKKLFQTTLQRHLGDAARTIATRFLQCTRDIVQEQVQLFRLPLRTKHRKEVASIVNDEE